MRFKHDLQISVLDALPTELGSFALGWPRIGNVFVRDGNQVQKLVGGC